MKFVNISGMLKVECMCSKKSNVNNRFKVSKWNWIQERGRKEGKQRGMNELHLQGRETRDKEELREEKEKRVEEI